WRLLAVLGRLGAAGAGGATPPHRAHVPIRRPSLQPRPAWLLPRARLSGLVRRPLCADGHDRRRHRGTVAAAVRLAVAAGRDGGRGASSAGGPPFSVGGRPGRITRFWRVPRNSTAYKHRRTR